MEKEPRTKSSDAVVHQTQSQDQVHIYDEQGIAILKTYTNIMHVLLPNPNTTVARNALPL